MSAIRFTITGLCVCIVVALSACNRDTVDYGYTIYGTVTEEATGRPIVGAYFLDSCRYPVGATDSLGRYTFGEFGPKFPAKSSLGFEAHAFESQCVPHAAALWNGDGYRLDIQLTRRYCPVPLAVIDRWEDTDGDGYWDDGEPYDPMTTGYRAPDDVGLALTLTYGNPAASIGDIYYPVLYPPLGRELDPQQGGDWLGKWMRECAPYEILVGDSLVMEPGRMVQVLTDELAARIALDPDAAWNDATDSVIRSEFAYSPRLLLVPLFDPSLPPTSGRNFVQVGQMAVLFLESTAGSPTFTARFVANVDAGSMMMQEVGSP